MLTLPSDIKLLINYLKNHTNKETAIYFRVGERTLSRKLKEYNLVKNGWGSGKLNISKAKAIRRLYRTENYSQLDLAEIFGVSRISIWKVINDRTYLEPNIHTSGSADTKLTIIYSGDAKFTHGN